MVHATTAAADAERLHWSAERRACPICGVPCPTSRGGGAGGNNAHSAAAPRHLLPPRALCGRAHFPAVHDVDLRRRHNHVTVPPRRLHLSSRVRRGGVSGGARGVARGTAGGGHLICWSGLLRFQMVHTATAAADPKQPQLGRSRAVASTCGVPCRPCAQRRGRFFLLAPPPPARLKQAAM